MLKFNSKLLKFNSKVLGGVTIPPDPYNPLGLPPNTVRVRTNDGNVPVRGSSTSYESATLVEGTTDVYDVYKSGISFYNLLRGCSNVVEVLGANTTGITNMSGMFSVCSALTSVSLFDTSSVTDMSVMFNYCSLTSVPLYDTSNVTNMSYMFLECSELETIPALNTSKVTNMYYMFQHSGITSVPLLDTSKVTDMSYMFSNCYYLSNIPLFDTSSATNMNYTFYGCSGVESGALALYQQASSQANPPSSHNNTFHNCGIDTVTGSAELAQIPSDWGGRGE